METRKAAQILVPLMYLFVQVRHGVSKPSCLLQTVRHMIYSAGQCRYLLMLPTLSLELGIAMTPNRTLVQHMYLLGLVLCGLNRPSCQH